MARAYSFVTSGGNAIIPVADDDFDVSDMSLEYAFGECFVQFLDGSGDPVTPTAGTISFKSGVFAGQFLDPPASATINAVDVIGAGTAVYLPPSFNSAVAFSRMTLLGIVGAVSVRAIHWRSEG